MPYPVYFPTGQSNKVHHSYIWLRSLIMLGAVLVVGGLTNMQDLVSLALYAGRNGANIVLVIVLAFLGVILIYGIVVGVSVLAYRNLRYVFDEKEFSLYSGIITKRRVHVPYARVQSVNHKQSIPQRLAGVCTVEIDTAGGSSNKAIRVPYVLLGTGEAIRQDLFVRKAANGAGASVVYAAPFVAPAAAGSPAPPVPGVNAPSVPMPTMPTMPTVGINPSVSIPASAAPPAPTTSPASAAPSSPVPMTQSVSNVPRFDAQGNILDAVSTELGVDDFRGLFDSGVAGMEPVSFERKLTNKELALCSVSNPGAFLAALSGTVLVVATALGMFVEEPHAVIALVVLVPILIGAFILALAVSIGAVALTYGNFSVRRRGNRIEVERGILQRDFSGISIDRIQSIVVRQSFIRKLMGYCEVSLGRINAAADKNTQGNSAKLNRGALVVHPFCKLDQVDALLDSLLPEFADRPASSQLKGLPAVALRRGILRRCLWRNSLFWMVVVCAVLQICFNLIIASTLPVSSDSVFLIRMVNIICFVLYAFFIIDAILSAIGAVWWKKGSGFALSKYFAVMRNDGWSVETVWLPRQKIQDVFTRTNPFQRAAGVTTICARTAAGVKSTYTQLWDIEAEDGFAWLQWMIPCCSQTLSQNQLQDSLSFQPQHLQEVRSPSTPM